MDNISMRDGALKIIERIHNHYPDRLNSHLDYSFVDCDFDTQTLTFSFPITDFTLNPSGTLHGGIVCTSIDITLGSLCTLLNDMIPCPTVELNTHFIKPVLQGDNLIITAKCLGFGKSLIHLSAQAVSLNTGKICACATGVFFRMAQQ